MKDTLSVVSRMSPATSVARKTFDTRGSWMLNLPKQVPRRFRFWSLATLLHTWVAATSEKLPPDAISLPSWHFSIRCTSDTWMLREVFKIIVSGKWNFKPPTREQSGLTFSRIMLLWTWINLKFSNQTRIGGVMVRYVAGKYRPNANCDDARGKRNLSHQLANNLSWPSVGACFCGLGSTRKSQNSQELIELRSNMWQRKRVRMQNCDDARGKWNF